MSEMTFGPWFRFKHWLAHNLHRCDGLCSYCYHDATKDWQGQCLFTPGMDCYRSNCCLRNESDEGNGG